MTISAKEHFDAAVLHQISIGQAANAIVVDLVGELDAGDLRIMTEASMRRRKVIAWIHDASREHVAAVLAMLTDELRDVAQAEGRFQAELARERFEDAEIAFPAGVLVAALAAVQSTGFRSLVPTTLRDDMTRWRARAANTLARTVSQALREEIGTEGAARVPRAVDVARARALGSRRPRGGAGERDGSRLNGGTRAPDRRELAAIARTSVDAIADEARRKVHEQVDEIDREIWASLLDRAPVKRPVCEFCRVLDGRIFELDRGPRPPGHPNCLTGDAVVSTRHRVSKTYTREYRGEVIRVGVQGQNVLTCTPNHPILTRAGWRAAKALKQGDEIACDVGSDGRSLRIGNDDKVESRIEDVSGALLMSGGMSTRAVPSSPVYFHGDGADGEIQIVSTESELGNDVADAASFEQFDQFSFASRLADNLALSSLGNFMSMFLGHQSSTNSIMRRGSQGDPFFGACTSHARELLLTAISGLLSSVPQMAINRQPTVSEGLRYPGDSYPVAMHFDGFSDMAFGHNRGHSHSEYSTMPQQVASTIDPDPELAGDCFTALQGQIQFRRLLSLDVGFRSTHVYNLETDSGWYTANGIVNHNCRCFRHPLRVGEDAVEALGGRELGFEPWLRKQPAAVQDAIVGKGKGVLFRRGGLPIDAFFDLAKRRAVRLDQIFRRFPKIAEPLRARVEAASKRRIAA